MKFFREFKDFAMKGNLVDIAVAFVMGGAFGKVVTALTEGVLAPVVGLFTGKDLSSYVIVIRSAMPEKKDTLGNIIQEAVPAIIIKYGELMTAIINFVIVAFVMFIIIKIINSMKKKQSEVISTEPSSMEKVLIEIRDALKK